MALAKKPKLTKVTPEEFERLLKGKNVPIASLKGIERNFVIRHGRNRTIEISDIIVTGQIVLTGDFPYPIRISGNSSLGEIQCRENVTIKELSFSDNVVVQGLAFFNNCKVKKVNIRSNSQIIDLLISGEAEVKELNATAKEINVLHIYGDAKVGLVNITYETETKHLYIYGKARIEEINIAGNSKIRKFELAEQAVIGDIKVSEFSSVERVKFKGGTLNRRLEFSNLKTTTFILEGTPLEIGRIVLSSVKLESLSFIDCNINSPLQIINLEVKKSFLLLKRVDKKGLQEHGFYVNKFDKKIYKKGYKSLIREWKKRSKKEKKSRYIEFTRSSLQKLELIGNDLRTFNHLVFENSNITNSFIAGTTFPKRIYTRLNNRISKSVKEYHNLYTNPQQAKLFYEQIKTAYIKQGNNTEALDFKAKELRQLHKLLIKSFWQWRGFLKRLFDRLTLIVNKWTNGYGVNWVRGIIVFFVATSLMYGGLLLSTDCIYRVPISEVSWADYKIYLSHYFDFINPTSTAWKKWEYLYWLEDLDPEKDTLSWGIKFQLFISKIIIITLAYQIIQAFRKFGRR